MRVGWYEVSPRRPLALAAVVASLVGPSLAFAATLTVTSPADDLDEGPNGNCTLREAVVAANTDAPVDACPAGAGPDRIELPAGSFVLAIAGRGEDAAATGDLDISDELVIEGLGAELSVIDGGQLDRVLHVLGADATLRGVTVRGGLAQDPVVARGGGILNAGGVLLLDRVTIADNEAEGLETGDGGDGAGGGLYNDAGSVSLVDARLVQNRASGGATTSPGVLGGGGFGGALYSAGGSVSAVGTTFHDNGASGGPAATVFLGAGPSTGGGLWSSGSLHLERSSIVHNGSFSVAGLWSAGELDLRNVTVDGNSTGIDCTLLSCSFGSGQLRNAGGTAALEHVTLGTGAFSQDLQNDGTMTLRASVIAGSCYGDPVTSLGANQSVGTGCGLTHPTDIEGLDPLLRALDTSGAVAVRLPRASSGVIDSADDLDCPATDARGVARPVDGDLDGIASCDRGSAELVCEGDDTDGDGIVDVCDSCPEVADPGALDSDGDGLGDACDSCPLDFDPLDRDVDGDGLGDACDPCTDVDGDGYVYPNPDGIEGCPGYPEVDCRDQDPNINPGQTEIPGNGVDDDCDDTTPACGPAEIVADSSMRGGVAPRMLVLLLLVPVALRASRRRASRG